LGSSKDFNSSAELLESEEQTASDEDADDVLLDSERDLLEAENASLQREFDTMADQVRYVFTFPSISFPHCTPCFRN
jgi:hypothetical protein